MATERDPGKLLDAWMDDIRHGGDGAVPTTRRRGLRHRLAALPWSWLLFPMIGWLAWRGLLRLALSLGFAAAPMLAVALMTWEAWHIGRRVRRQRLRQAARGRQAVAGALNA